MKKKLSFSIMMSVIVFLVLIISTSSFQTEYHVGDKFGWPFVFFTAFNNHEFVTDQNFSVINFVLDFAICLVATIGLYNVVGKLRVARKA